MDEPGGDEAIELPDGQRKEGELRSGGDVAYDEATNEAFYAVRLGRLLDILGTSLSVEAPLRLLDAGCGTGRFTRALTRCGHNVEGIDSSPSAVEVCRTEAIGPDRYSVSEPVSWTSPHLYDGVFAMDALFRLTQDDVWRRSVTNLASLVRLGGLLALADHDAPPEHPDDAHHIVRVRRDYTSLVLPLGFRYQGFVAYRFRDHPAGLHVLRRVA
jgi:2-polyprenyl-3-methyl-5-hydroxy-6-metoxy-1,4-benzoquinol methylase